MTKYFQSPPPSLFKENGGTLVFQDILASLVIVVR
jgi:hypothetical protein